jgi:aspartyl-tRNA(Asn)/glutamyl-tRNA(Gln) amidotransferase subunit C
MGDIEKDLRITVDNTVFTCIFKYKNTFCGALFSMALNIDDVQRIAELAHLRFSPEEHEATLQELNRFFLMAQRMSEINTQGIEPLYTPLATVKQVSLRLRHDSVSASSLRKDNQRSAPAIQDGLYLVPKVIAS